MSEQIDLTDFEKRQAKFAHTRALILRIVYAEEGLNIEEISKRFLLKHGFLPHIDNRIRELRTEGLVVTPKGNDKRIHVYPKKEELE